MSLQYHYIYERDQYNNTGNSNNFFKILDTKYTREEYCIDNLDRNSKYVCFSPMSVFLLHFPYVSIYSRFQ